MLHMIELDVRACKLPDNDSYHYKKIPLLQIQSHNE